MLADFLVTGQIAPRSCCDFEPEELCIVNAATEQASKIVLRREEF
jgi:hypothetical protein